MENKDVSTHGAAKRNEITYEDDNRTAMEASLGALTTGGNDISTELQQSCKDEISAGILKNESEPDTYSIHSYTGNVADLSTDELAFHELGETDEVRERTLEQLRSWVSMQSHLKTCCRSDATLCLNDPQCLYSRSVLLRFLRVNKFSVRKATVMMDSYLKMRCDYPQWYKGLGDCENKGFMELVESGYIFVAPGRDKLGRKVVINLASECDASRHNASDIMRAVMATVETLLVMDEDTQIRGLSYIFYCKGLTFSHCKLFSPIDMARMFTGCDNNIPLRHRAMFIVSMPFGMGRLLDLGKTFLGPVKKRIHILSDVSKLLETSNELLKDPNILPIEIIGESGKYTAKEMAAMWKQEILSHETYLKNLDDLVVTSSEENTKAGSKDSSEGNSGSKKSWFGSWSRQ